MASLPDCMALTPDNFLKALQYNREYYDTYYSTGPFDIRLLYWIAGNMLVRGIHLLPKMVSRKFDDAYAAIHARALPYVDLTGVDALRLTRNDEFENIELKSSAINPEKLCLSERGTLYKYSGSPGNVTSKKTYESTPVASFDISNDKKLGNKNMPTVVTITDEQTGRLITQYEIPGKSIVKLLAGKKSNKRTISLRQMVKHGKCLSVGVKGYQNLYHFENSIRNSLTEKHGKYYFAKV